MSKQQALVVFCPSKKHYNEAIDLSLRLNSISSTSNDMNFKNHNKRKMCTYEDGDQENSVCAKILKKSKKHYNEAIDLSLRLNSSNDMNFKNHNKRKMCTYEDGDQENSVCAKILKKSKKHYNEAIDLSLRLNSSNDMNFKNHNKRKMCTYEDGDQENSVCAKILKKFRFYTKEEEAEEKFNGVCTILKLYDDPWKIKKVLQQSDVNNNCRLMISKRLVEQHIVKVWERAGRFENVWGLGDRDGVSVKVWDCDREKEFVLTMKKHDSSECYVLLTNWSRQFVSERGLKKGDEIGLFWCNFSGRFFFSVLARARL